MALSSHSGSTRAESPGQSCAHQQWPGEVNTEHQVTLWHNVGHEALTQAVHVRRVWVRAPVTSNGLER